VTEKVRQVNPIFVLWAKAELEGVAKFSVPDEAVWVFDVKQGSGSDERKGVVIDPDESQPVPNTKNTMATFLVKFEGDKGPSYLKVLRPGEEGFPKSLTLRAQTADDTDKVPIFACECRGMEPTRWTPRGPYCAESAAGDVFTDVDLTTEDWCEYGEKSAESMSIGMAIEQEFKLHRGK